MKWSRTSSGKEEIDSSVFSEMLGNAARGIQSLGEAKVGDKTLLDTFIPAMDAFNESLDDFDAALDRMMEAAEKGKDSTIDLVAKVGRASRLGKRSRGVFRRRRHILLPASGIHGKNDKGTEPCLGI